MLFDNRNRRQSFWNTLAVRFDQKSTRFGTCGFRKDLDDQNLRFGQVTKPKTFGAKVGTRADERKIELCVLRELQTTQTWQTSQS